MINWPQKYLIPDRLNLIIKQTIIYKYKTVNMKKTNTVADYDVRTYWLRNIRKLGLYRILWSINVNINNKNALTSFHLNSEL